MTELLPEPVVPEHSRCGVSFGSSSAVVPSSSVPNGSTRSPGPTLSSVPYTPMFLGSGSDGLAIAAVGSGLRRASRSLSTPGSSEATRLA